MPLAPGTRLGPYEVISSLGSGGMGEVYTARDTRLGRTVAIKVLSAALSSSPDARDRLKREARTLSQLSHPHICALYDVGEQGDIDFLVMEVLAGETLAARLAKGPLPFGQVVSLATGIAGALDAAHRRGIVHRDLKPGNVMLTPTGVKLLDFGLAKLFAPLVQGSQADRTASFKREVTTEGTTLGTIQYMSPEQLEGRPADARSDLFAFGATLFEMATGRRAFAGESPAAIASAIMATDPPAVSSLQPAAPAAFDRLVQGCCVKDPGERWQSAHDAVLLLQSIAEPDPRRASPSASWSPTVLRWAPWVIAAAAIALFITRGVWPRPAASAPPQPVTFTISPPPGSRFFSGVESVEMAVSPDGTKIAFVASDAAGQRVWLRPLADADATPLPGTEGATAVFWSPNGASLGFFSGAQLKRIDLPGGTPVGICPTARSFGYSGSWGRDGRILFASISSGTAIMAASSAGGTPVEERKSDASQGEVRLLFPHFLPDGRQYLYLAKGKGVGGQLMLAVDGQPPRAIMSVASNVQYVDPGYLVYARDGTLLARRFDVTSGRVSGDPIAIADSVNYFRTTSNAHFSTSSGGMVAFQSHSDVSHVAWFDRTGTGTETAIATMPPGGYLGFRMSADGHEVLLARAEPGTGTFDIWRLDLGRGIDIRLTADPGNEIAALFVPGRRAFVYSRSAEGPPHMVIRDEVTGAESPVTPGADFQDAQDITPDGQWLVFTQRKRDGTDGLLVVRLAEGDRTPSAAYDSPFEHGSARFSPDGHWLAFSAADSGRWEIYVAPFPATGRKERVSTHGGTAPRWRRDGRELLYVSGGALMAVPLTAGRSAGPPVPVFKFPGAAWTDFDVTAAGRFLAIVPETFANQQPMTVIVNWPAKLR